MRLGSGIALKLSPDGAWALTLSRSRKELKLLPTGPGEPRALNGTFDTYWGDADWLPDGKRIVFTAMEPKHDPRVWGQDVASEQPSTNLARGTRQAGLSGPRPDGHSVARTSNQSAANAARPGWRRTTAHHWTRRRRAARRVEPRRARALRRDWRHRADGEPSRSRVGAADDVESAPAG